jgi:hypothetical protein
MIPSFMPADSHDLLSFVVSEEELALVEKLRFPCAEFGLGTAQRTRGGVECHGKRFEVRDLVGWIAAEVNHNPHRLGRRQIAMLNRVADELDDVLMPPAR